MHLKSERRGGKFSDHPLDPSLFGEKNFVKTTKNSAKRADHFFLARSIIFQIRPFFIKFNYSNMVDPGNFMI